MIYFDNASTTKPSDLVLKEYLEESKNNYANPSSINKLGVDIFFKVERIKKHILNALNLSNNYEIIFTSGATESNNLAILGYCFKNMNRGKRIITSLVEHASVLNVFKYLATEGFEVIYLNVDNEGNISFEELQKSLNDKTILVSLMGVNNEIGSILNLDEVHSLVTKFPRCVFHSDCAQALGKVDLSYSMLDMITISGHKIHGLKGIGALIKRKNISITPLFYGGGQQENLRSGTIDYPAISAFSLAIDNALKTSKENYLKVESIFNYLYEKLKNNEEVVINSPFISSKYIFSLSLKTQRASVVVEALSNEEIYLNTTSSCDSRKDEPSHVIMALNNNLKLAKNTLRLSFSYENTLEEAKIFLDSFLKILKNIRG